MESNQEPAPLPSTQRGTSEGESGEVSTQRHSDGANAARPKHGALAGREYSLLVLEDLAGDPDAAGPQGSGDSPEDTTGTGGNDGRETGTEERNEQRAPLACGQPEDKEEEQRPPKRQRAINT